MGKISGKQSLFLQCWRQGDRTPPDGIGHRAKKRAAFSLLSARSAVSNFSCTRRRDLDLSAAGGSSFYPDVQ
jgi:hypothetical protein